MALPRILWISDSPVLTTGFGRVTREVLGRLARMNRFEVACLGWFGPDRHEERGATYDVPLQSSDKIGFASLLIAPEEEWLEGRDDLVQAPLFRITNGGNYGVHYTYIVRIRKHPQDERKHVAVFVSQGRGERPDPNTD